MQDFWRIICLHLIIQTARKTLVILGHEGLWLAAFQGVQKWGMCHTLKQCCAVSKRKYQEANAIQCSKKQPMMPRLMASRCSADDIGCVQYPSVCLSVYNFLLKAQHFFPSSFVYMCKCCSRGRNARSKVNDRGTGDERGQ